MRRSMSPQEFVDKWRKSTLKESAAYQEHFHDVCRLAGHATPAEEDPSGTHFTFQAGAAKGSGGQGFADVWYRGYFAWEYKSKHADLGKAYDQLLQYREALENPPLLIVSDFETIVIHTNFTNTVRQVVTLTLDDLLRPEKRDLLRDAFFNPEVFKVPVTTEKATENAAKEFARIAELLRKYGADPHQAAHFLIRLLFCLFAEDTHMLPNNLFSRLITQLRKNPATVTAQLRQLFAAMSTGGYFGLDQIPHFDGHLFDDDSALQLDSDSLEILARISAMDWSSIEPAVFGTLFERSLDPSKRSQLGAHYTSKEDILLIIEPVLMAPLRRRWEEVKKKAQELAAKRDKAKRAQHTKLGKQIRALLTGFVHELASIRVLDPACGSGNFLYVALKQLLDLEKEVGALAAQLQLSRMYPSVSPAQLHGIEVNEYAQELAQATIWIGYIQWLRDNGFGEPPAPILKPLDNIRKMDAVLSYDKQDQPVEPEWPGAEVIIGNPPFVGGKKLRAELGDKYVDELFTLYQGRVPHEADLVCYWFERARAQIVAGKANRAGLLATQAIRAGAGRRVLRRIKASGDIFMAWSDRPWILEGAAVRVSMVGFDKGIETPRVLDGRAVPTINADLTGALDLTQARRLVENQGICFQGPVKVGPFDIDSSTAETMLKAPNPHGRPSTEVIKPWMNASDITGRPRGMWIIDFGEMNLEEAVLFESPFEYVRENVKPLRDSNRDWQRRTFWWRLGRSGGDFKSARKSRARIIVTPRVSRHRVFVWASAELLPDSRVYAFTRDDDYFFGVLHSRVHEVWSLATSSRHGVGNDPTYNNTTCFETFPFPWPPGQEPVDDPRVQAIATAAHELVEQRDAWPNPPGASDAELKKRTLTNLYNQHPTWLQLAHRKLDEAVFDAYGWPHDLNDEEILERLLALNLERAAASG